VDRSQESQHPLAGFRVEDLAALHRIPVLAQQQDLRTDLHRVGIP
jgi:hypothetical protein